MFSGDVSPQTPCMMCSEVTHTAAMRFRSGAVCQHVLSQVLCRLSRVVTQTTLVVPFLVVFRHVTPEVAIGAASIVTDRTGKVSSFTVCCHM